MNADKMRKIMMQEAHLASTDYTPELLDEVEQILKAHLMMAWEWIHRATSDITGDHKIVLRHPVKCPSLEVYDNLTALIAEMKESLTVSKEKE